MYVPEYTNSWALIIGINSYNHTHPLGYACNDAEVVARTIKDRFRFPEENIVYCSIMLLTAKQYLDHSWYLRASRLLKMIAYLFSLLAMVIPKEVKGEKSDTLCP